MKGSNLHVFLLPRKPTPGYIPGRCFPYVPDIQMSTGATWLLILCSILSVLYHTPLCKHSQEMQFEKVTRPPENAHLHSMWMQVQSPSPSATLRLGCLSRLFLFSSRILFKLQSKYKTTTNHVVKHSSSEKSPWYRTHSGLFSWWWAA